MTDNKVTEQKAHPKNLVEVIAALLNREADMIVKRIVESMLMERLAELEEIDRWRPVSERPPNDAPVLALLESGEYKVARYVVVGDVNGVPLHHWRGTGGSSKHVAYWRPITEEAPAK